MVTYWAAEMGSFPISQGFPVSSSVYSSLGEPKCLWRCCCWFWRQDYYWRCPAIYYSQTCKTSGQSKGCFYYYEALKYTDLYIAIGLGLGLYEERKYYFCFSKETYTRKKISYVKRLYNSLTSKQYMNKYLNTIRTGTKGWRIRYFIQASLRWSCISCMSWETV